MIVWSSCLLTKIYEFIVESVWNFFFILIHSRYCCALLMAQGSGRYVRTCYRYFTEIDRDPKSQPAAWDQWSSALPGKKIVISVISILMWYMITIQKFFLILISRSFKKGASNNTISYFDQSFQFCGLWLILVRHLRRSGQKKSRGTENRENK